MKCIPPFAPNAARTPKSRSGPEGTALYIAATALVSSAAVAVVVETGRIDTRVQRLRDVLA